MKCGRVLTHMLILMSLLIGIAYADGIPIGNPSSATATTRVTVINGATSITVLPTEITFDAKTLIGVNQQTYSAMSDITVVDSRGTGAGWHVTIQASDLTQAADPSKKIPISLGGLTLDSTGTINLLEGSVDGNPNPIILPIAGDLSSPQKLLSAPITGGKGAYLYTATNPRALVLQISASAYAGDYSGDITASLMDGP